MTTSLLFVCHPDSEQQEDEAQDGAEDQEKKEVDKDKVEASEPNFHKGEIGLYVFS